MLIKSVPCGGLRKCRLQINEKHGPDERRILYDKGTRIWLIAGSRQLLKVMGNT
jgi:hypothetical protein